MDWTWNDPRIWAAAVIVVQFVLWATDRLAARKFVSHEQLDQVKGRLENAHHRIDLLHKDVTALPNHSQVHELREDVGELKEGQATSRAKLEGIGREIGILRGTVERLDEFMRTNK